MIKLPEIDMSNPKLTLSTYNQLSQDRKITSYRLVRCRKPVNSRGLDKQHEIKSTTHLMSHNFGMSSYVMDTNSLNKNEETNPISLNQRSTVELTRSFKNSLPNQESKLRRMNRHFYSKKIETRNYKSQILSKNDQGQTLYENDAYSDELGFHSVTYAETSQSDSMNESTNNLLNHPKLNLTLPKIDVLNRSGSFKTSSLRDLRTDWAKQVKSYTRSTTLVARQERLQELRVKEEERLKNREEIIKRNKHLKNVRLWQKAISKVILTKKQQQLRIHMYWMNASKEIMRRNFRKKAGTIGDQYKVIFFLLSFFHSSKFAHILES